jgi:hypothetical protein
MALRLRALLRSPRRRLALMLVSVGLAGAIELTHAVPGADHMGQGAAMCLAVLAISAVAVASAPRMGRWFPSPPRPRDERRPVLTAARVFHGALARGDPADLQVFRL